MSRVRRAGAERSGEWKAFLVVVSITVIPVLATVGVIQVSSRPSLAYRKFPASATVVDWPALARIRDGAAAPSAVARIPGYMIQFDDPVDSAGRVARFLLVPDPGNWLHPPHLDDGEVVIVRMRDGARTPFLDGIPVWVEGQLTVSPVKTTDVQTVLQLEASSISALL
jgi:hypothetical protein